MKYLNFETNNSNLQPNLGKDMTILVEYSYGPKRYLRLESLGFMLLLKYETGVVQVFKSVFSFQDIKKCEFSLYFAENCGNLYFRHYQEYNFNDHFMIFSHFLLRYRNLMFSSTCANIRAHSQ